MTKVPKENQQRQIREFRKAARELGADASDEQFQAVLRTVAKAKPSSDQRVKSASNNRKK
jgi:hypothetical protein